MTIQRSTLEHLIIDRPHEFKSVSRVSDGRAFAALESPTYRLTISGTPADVLATLTSLATAVADAALACAPPEAFVSLNAALDAEEECAYGCTSQDAAAECAKHGVATFLGTVLSSGVAALVRGSTGDERVEALETAEHREMCGSCDAGLPMNCTCPPEDVEHPGGPLPRMFRQGEVVGRIG